MVFLLKTGSHYVALDGLELDDVSQAGLKFIQAHLPRPPVLGLKAGAATPSRIESLFRFLLKVTVFSVTVLWSANWVFCIVSPKQDLSNSSHHDQTRVLTSEEHRGSVHFII